MKQNANTQLKKDSIENLDKWGETLGGRFHLIYVDVKCLRFIVDFMQQNPASGKKFTNIFNYFYRMFFDRMYIKIYKLLDKRKDAISLKNFLKKSGEMNQWRNIENHAVCQKIKKKRHDIIAHSNQELALNQDYAHKHHEQNKLHLSEIISFLENIQETFESVIAKNGKTILHYALGDGKEVNEFKKLLLLSIKQ